MLCELCHKGLDVLRGWYIFQDKAYCALCWIEKGVGQECASARLQENAGNYFWYDELVNDEENKMTKQQAQLIIDTPELYLSVQERTAYQALINLAKEEK